MKFEKKIFLSLLLYQLIPCFVLAQTTRQSNFYSPLNRLKFGNYLFAQKDYLRAIGEYNSYLSVFKNDTVKFKIAFANSEMGKSLISANEFKSLFNSPALDNYAKLYYVREKLKDKDLNYFNNGFTETRQNFQEDSSFVFKNDIKMMKNISGLFGDKNFQTLNEFLLPFPENIKSRVKYFYARKIHHAYKSEQTAGLLSAIIPGSGKIYSGKIGDGITAFIVTGLLTFIAVDNFNANHKTRAWIFSGLASAFYAGNIYGSIVAARQYNLGIQISFGNDLTLFLKKHNYFAHIPKFLLK